MIRWKTEDGRPRTEVSLYRKLLAPSPQEKNERLVWGFASLAPPLKEKKRKACLGL